MTATGVLAAVVSPGLTNMPPLLVRHFLYFLAHHRNDLEPFSIISLILALLGSANGIGVQPSS
jgi:hypothetical protein